MSWVLLAEIAWMVLFEWFGTESRQVWSYLAEHSPAQSFITALSVHQCSWCWCAHLKQDQNTWHNLGQQTHFWFSCRLYLCRMFLPHSCFSTHSAQSHAGHGKIGRSLSNLFHVLIIVILFCMAAHKLIFINCRGFKMSLPNRSVLIMLTHPMLSVVYTGSPLINV